MRIKKSVKIFLVIASILFIGYLVFITIQKNKLSSQKTDVRTTRVTEEQIKETEEIAKNAIFESPEFVNQKEQEYLDSLANEPSDIEGMTKLDKLDAGLMPDDGADSDQDGLTDKEEIEVYNSDPLKKSTSGDLYTDGYKVAHDMDLNESYEYTLDMIAENNTCDEVSLEFDSIEDFSAVVEDITGNNKKYYAMSVAADWLENYNVLKEYRLYNYSGPVDIDLSDVIKTSGISEENIGAMLTMEGYSDGWQNALNKDFNYTIENKTLKIEDREYASGIILMVYEKTEDTENFEQVKDNKIVDLFEGLPFTDTFMLSEEDKIGGDVLITFNWLAAITRSRPNIRYVPTGDPEMDAYTIEACLWIARYLSDADLDTDLIDPLELNSSHCQEISPRTYKFLDNFYRTFFPGFMTADWKSAITIIDTEVFLDFLSYVESGSTGDKTTVKYDNGMKYVVDKENQKQTLYNPDGSILWSAVYTEGFSHDRDRFPFGNFKTQAAPGGNCAGLVQFMNVAFNTKDFPTSGGQGEQAWDLLCADDKDNENLIKNKNLKMYKNLDFIKEHRNPQGLISGLSVGEVEFVKMISDYQEQMNSRSHIKKQVGKTNYSYELIEEMIQKLDEGKILGCSFDTYSLDDDLYQTPVPSGGHAVTIYDYRYIDDKTINFYVYDTNIPWDKYYNNLSYSVSGEDGTGRFEPSCMYIQVVRTTSTYGNADTFEYMYQPLPCVQCDDSYFSTSRYWFTSAHDPNGITNYRFSVWDESGEIISNKY